jgi:choline dehydrogenase-like flavoprotein
MESYDVIIVGTGAGGGTLARHLAPSGKRILLLERGDWLPREPHNTSFFPSISAVNPASRASRSAA